MEPKFKIFERQKGQRRDFYDVKISPKGDKITITQSGVHKLSITKGCRVLFSEDDKGDVYIAEDKTLKNPNSYPVGGSSTTKSLHVSARDIPSFLKKDRTYRIEEVISPSIPWRKLTVIK